MTDSSTRRAQLPVIEFRDALISDDGKYRYWLERRWSGADFRSPLVLWCMLNPSTADAQTDDATIRRCVGFSNEWGFGRLIVVNLYAYRATDPSELDGLDAADLQGPENEFHLRYWVACSSTRLLMCAWGGNRFKCLPLPRVISDGSRYALRITATGEPSHPLYLPGDLKPMRIEGYA